ncbi:MAG: stage III sporulation protein AB [Oscillospiraceae bacterium]
MNKVWELLPEALQGQIEGLPEGERERIEEVRLRQGRPMSVSLPTGERFLAGDTVDGDALRRVLERASFFSVHTVLEQLRNGFVAVQGGHRLGLCGTGVVEDGRLVNLRSVSSLSLRQAREVKGIAAKLVPQLFEEGQIKNTLILAPPGQGKTTLLRDLIRAISSGENCIPRRVGLADERGEVASVWEGSPMLDVGPRTDIMDSCPKSIGMLALLRSMSPQVLAVDEITREADAEALLQALGCGVSLLATAHGGSIADLERRHVYQRLTREQVFERFILIQGTGKERRYNVVKQGERKCEA